MAVICGWCSQPEGVENWNLIISPDGITLEKSLRLSFSVTNNETEYKALRAGLIAI